MTAVAAISPDLRRRVAIALATAVAALALPASANALVYCVKPATGGGCIESYTTKEKAIAAAEHHAGDDFVRVLEGAETHNIPVRATDTPTGSRTSAFDDVTNFMLTWLPLIFMGIICLLI